MKPLLVTLSFVFAACIHAETQKPNVLFILADDLGVKAEEGG